MQNMFKHQKQNDAPTRKTLTPLAAFSTKHSPPVSITYTVFKNVRTDEEYNQKKRVIWQNYCKQQHQQHQQKQQKQKQKQQQQNQQKQKQQKNNKNNKKNNKNKSNKNNNNDNLNKNNEKPLHYLKPPVPHLLQGALSRDLVDVAVPALRTETRKKLFKQRQPYNQLYLLIVNEMLLGVVAH